MRFQSTNVQPVAGLPLPVTSGGFQSFIDANGDVWIAKPGVDGGKWNRPSDVLKTRVYRNTAFTILGPGAAYLTFDATTFDIFGLYAGSPGSWTCPLNGMYNIYTQVGYTPTLSGQSLSTRLYRNGANTTLGQHDSAATGAGWASIVPVYDTWQLTATEWVATAIASPNLAGAGSLAGQPGSAWTYLIIEYAGTG